MTDDYADGLLTELLKLPFENELVEFKSVTDGHFDKGKISKYLSGLANEANIRGANEGWLIFGVNDHKEIVGTPYLSATEELDNFKTNIANEMTDRHTFSDIYVVNRPEGRVVMFRVPPAPRGSPVSYKYEAWGREGSSLVLLSEDKRQQILSQSRTIDWSAKIVKDATVADLDPDAIQLARKNYLRRSNPSPSYDTWDDTTFLQNMSLLVQNHPTQSALLLLGKAHSDRFLDTTDPRITWVNFQENGKERDYHHAGLPFLLSIEAILSKIRILRYRHINDYSLFNDEMDTYDTAMLREALNNSIAHQDYRLGGRITVAEHSEYIEFTNPGNFIPRTLEQVLTSSSPGQYHRNPHLVRVMERLQLVENIGSGIKTMFLVQQKRRFPMPDFTFNTENNTVSVRLYGKIINLDFSLLLSKREELTLWELALLDNVQKHKPIDRNAARQLREKGLIEGRYPNLFISKQIAVETGNKAKYSKNKGLSYTKCIALLIEALEEHKNLSRSEINEILKGALSDFYSEKQYNSKIDSILRKARQGGIIRVEGHGRSTRWLLA